MRAAGMAYTIQLCRDFLDQGAPGIHIYALNRSTAAAEIVTALRESGHLPQPAKKKKAQQGNKNLLGFSEHHKKGGLKARYCPNLGRYLHHHLRAPVQAQSPNGDCWRRQLESTGASRLT